MEELDCFKITQDKYGGNQRERVFSLVAKLYAHDQNLKDLEEMRLNPDYTSKTRSDLEFYIPQLCIFTLFGEYEVVEELVSFLCKACHRSFFFAHRVIWFLKSLQNLDKAQKQKYLFKQNRGNIPHFADNLQIRFESRHC